MSSNAKRLEFLDGVRGLAALSVMVAHYVFDIHAPGNMAAAYSPAVEGIDGSIHIGKAGVALFFLLSGFIVPAGLGKGADKIGKFCVGRFFRLYPLYWIALTIGVLVTWPVQPHGFSLRTILINTTMLQGFLGAPNVIGATWTLQIELFFYAICVLMASQRQLASARACAIVSISALAVAFAMAVARALLVVKLPVALPLAMSLMFFAAVWRQATVDRLPEARRLSMWLLGAIAASILPISVIGYRHDFGFDEHWLPYATSYFLALAIFVLCTTRLKITWRPLGWFGRMSYSVFFMHPLVAAAAFHIGIVNIAMPVAPLPAAVPLMGMVVLLAWLSSKYIERPFVKLGHRFEPAAQRRGKMFANA